MAIQYQNFYETTTTGSVTDASTYIPLTTPPTITEGWLLLDWDVPASREFVYFTSKDATGVFVTLPNRGRDGTTAVAHLSGAKVRMNVNAGMLSDTLAGLNITTNAITTTKIADANVTSAKLAAGAVIPGKLALGAADAVSTTSVTSVLQTYNSMTGAPSVTVTTGTTALVTITSFLQNDTANNLTYASFAVGGATTQAATDNKSVRYQSYAANSNTVASGTFLVTGLTAGSNTFTLQNRVGGNTGTYGYRYIAVVPL